MKVPLLDLRAQNLPLEEELCGAFKRVLHSGQFILGEEVEAFEREAAQALKSKYALAISSGTDALLLALMSLGIGPEDEVLCPSFTFFATAGCVARLGAIPLFVDICPVCFNIDMDDAAQKISRRTKAIMPVHLFGQAVNMKKVLELAYQHELYVIEDAAQAFGAKYHDAYLGTLGHFGAFSFFPTKNLGAFGDAGLLATQDEELFHQARILRNHGMEPRYHHDFIGGNFRLDALQTALLGVKLPHCASYSEKRREHAAYYTEKLSKLKGVSQADTTRCCSHYKKQRSQPAYPAQTKIILPPIDPENASIWHQYTLRVPNNKRDDLKAFLSQHEIGCEVYYPIPLHLQKCFQRLSPHPCPVAEQMAQECLSIPVSSELTSAQQEYVIAALNHWLAHE